MNKIILIFYPPIITVELPVKTVPSLGAISPNALLIYSAAFVMKFVIGFNDSVTDKSPPAGASLQLVPNSQFSPHPTCPTRPTSRIIACVAHIPRWRELVARAQFKIHNSEFKIPTRIIGLKNSFLYGG